jgi:AraC-like DNA-binding protein
MSHLRYGGDVDILPGPLERFYLLQIPVRGHAAIDSGGRDFVSDPGCAAMLSPQPNLRMRWQAGNEQLLVRMETETVQRFAQAWSGRPDLPAPVFDPCLRLDAQPAVHDALLSLLAFNAAAGALPAQDDAAPGTQRYALSAAQLQHRLVAALLAGQPHDQAQALEGSGPPLAPRSVRAVEDYLVAHCAEPLTPEQLAAHAGVSVRSLFLGFQRFRGVSPMRLLRELRLHRTHDELLCGTPGMQVTDVALRWGFCHLGRFGQEYRAMFGESPRDTLRAAQAA